MKMPIKKQNREKKNSEKHEEKKLFTEYCVQNMNFTHQERERETQMFISHISKIIHQNHAFMKYRKFQEIRLIFFLFSRTSVYVSYFPCSAQ